jgi:transcriptional regulator with XRE-family HTH domain
MSRQVDKKYKDLGLKFYKVLTVSGIKRQSDFAMRCQINPGTLSKALERESLSEDIVDKIYDAFRVRKDFWEDGKEPIIDENHTPAIKSSDNKETRYMDFKEGHPDYYMVPKTMVQGEYRLELLSEIESKKSLLQKTLDTQDALIIELRREIAELRSKLSEVLATNRA